VDSMADANLLESKLRDHKLRSEEQRRRWRLG
jgi:hypothetical protein